MRQIIRDEFKKLGTFNALAINKDFQYSKRLIKMICKKTFVSSVDTPRIENHLITRTNLVELNTEKYKTELIKNIKKRIKKKEYVYYMLEISEYIDRYVELYIDFDVSDFMDYSIEKMRNGY